MKKEIDPNRKASFQERVYVLTQKIPAGKVATYSQIALLAGNPKATRAVGMCMSKNKDPHNIPCHRVVSAKGKLTGYAFGGTLTKKEKLLKEGVRFHDNIIDLATSQWNPEGNTTR